MADSNGLAIIFFGGKMKYVVGLVIFPLSVSCNDFVSCLYSTGNGMIKHLIWNLVHKSPFFRASDFQPKKRPKKKLFCLFATPVVICHYHIVN